MGTFLSRWRGNNMTAIENIEEIIETSSQLNKESKMTKKEIIKTIEDKHRKANQNIASHQNNADKYLSKADAKLKAWVDNGKDIGDCYKDYTECEEMRMSDSHASLVRSYKLQKEMLGELLEEIN